MAVSGSRLAVVRWTGEKVAERIAEAARRAIDETNAEAVAAAKGDHPWTNRTGTLEGAIQMRPAAQEADGEIVGLFGAFAVAYAIYLELGTARMPPYPFLRPAADAAWGELGARIRANLEASR